VSEDPTPAQKPLFESATQVTDYKTQKIYDSNAHKELPAQPVDATLAKLLIGQRFPEEKRNVRL
jgi:hypothetical protein